MNAQERQVLITAASIHSRQTHFPVYSKDIAAETNLTVQRISEILETLADDGYILPATAEEFELPFGLLGFTPAGRRALRER